jgi:hypothetical protein
VSNGASLREVRRLSYDLFFWREEPGPRHDPRAVFDALLDDRPVDGPLQFPVEDFLGAIVEVFPTAVREEDGAAPILVWLSDNGRSMFEVSCSPLHAHVTLRSVENDTANRLVTIAADLGAPLYDPQTGERFDSWIDA